MHIFWLYTGYGNMIDVIWYVYVYTYMYVMDSVYVQVASWYWDDLGFRNKMHTLSVLHFPVLSSATPSRHFFKTACEQTSWWHDLKLTV